MRYSHTKLIHSALFMAAVILTACGGGGGGGAASTTTYTIGGAVSGLTGTGLVLQKNGADNLSISNNGNFVFAAPQASGTTYTVTVLTQPTGQTCTVNPLSGTVSTANVTTVAVTCSAGTYTIGGSVTGLTGTGLVLQNNGGNNLSIGAGATTFTFSAALASGAGYNVTVLTQPAGQTCTASNNTGTVAAANVNNVAVTCTAVANTYTIGGTIAGLAGAGLVLQNNGGDNLSIGAAATGFVFSTPVTSGAGYNVTVLTQPVGQTCTASNNTGTVAAANIATVVVACSSNPYYIGGAVTGLAAGKSVVLQNNGADDYSMFSNSTFSFFTPVASGATYNVTVKTQPVGQTCTASNNTGTVAAADITNVVVTCSSNTYFIGGSVTGLTGTVVLRNNGSNDLSISAIGPFNFTAKVASGAAYAVTVFTQPAGQICTVTNGAGSNVVADVTSVAVACVNTYTIGGNIISSVAGIGPTLQNNGGDNLFVSAIINGITPFTFSTPVADGLTYAVTQLSRASAPTQNCTVTGGDDNAGGGTVASVNVASVVVTCTPTAVVPKFAYVANSMANPAVGAADTVSAYTINGTTGALTFSGTVASGDEPYSVAVEPYGKFAYVANRSADSISVYSINAASGALALSDASGVGGFQASIATGDAPISITAHPSGKFLYVVNQGNGSSTGNTISAYSIDTLGALSVIDADGAFGYQSSIATGALPYAVTVDPTGRFAYVANDSSNNVSAYTINQTSGALTDVAGSPVAAGTNPRSVAIDPTGKFAFVANGGSDNVSAYTINQTSGALTPVAGGSVAAGIAPRAVAVEPSGLYAYVANAGSDNVSAYTINQSSGVLTPVAGSPFAAGATPFSVAIDPSGKFVYVANFTSTSTPGSVSTYSIGGAGALTPVGSATATGIGPTSVTTAQ